LVSLIVSEVAYLGARPPGGTTKTLSKISVFENWERNESYRADARL
jgi:hypothetical protein